MATMTLSSDDESSAHTNTIVMDTFEGDKIKMNTKNIDKKHKHKKSKLGEKFKSLFPLLSLIFIIVIVFLPQSQNFISSKLNISGMLLIGASAALISSIWYFGDTMEFI